MDDDIDSQKKSTGTNEIGKKLFVAQILYVFIYKKMNNVMMMMKIQGAQFLFCVIGNVYVM